EVARRAELVADPAVADRAGEAGHRRAHRGAVDGDVGPGDGGRPLVAADPHRLLLAVEVYQLPGCALLPERADVADDLPHVADGLAERNVVPVLVESLHARAETEDEAAAGHVVEVQRLQRGDHGTAGEGQRDAGADPGALRRGGDRGG